MIVEEILAEESDIDRVLMFGIMVFFVIGRAQRIGQKAGRSNHLTDQANVN